jgi:folate-binding protein YgfZ
MNPGWKTYLQSRHAIIQDDRVAHYGNAAAELASAGSETVLADLSHFGLIGFSGEDAQSFLQGQVSCDVRLANHSAAVHGSYCNPKGRMLANFLLWHDKGGYAMQLPAALQPAIQKRLSMYVLRAKVKLTDISDTLIRIGIAGNKADALIANVLDVTADHDLGMFHGERGSVFRLGEDRFELIVAPEQGPEVWERLSKDAVPVGAPCWDWLQIKAGIPVITLATQEQFIPQMANLDMIGGISFQKGCYPGQEIVARSQHLGKIKRRMYLAHIRSAAPESPVNAGDELFSVDTGEQSSGMVVNATASPDGGFDMLAIIQISSVEAGEVHWKALDGPALEIMPLPYSQKH